MFYNKCVKEPQYIKLYMDLVDSLIGKIKKEEYGFEFRKIFVNYCESKLVKINLFLSEPLSRLRGADEDEEILEKKERIYGSVILIGNLFIRGFAPDSFIKECIEKLLKDPSQVNNIENVILLIKEIGENLYEHYAFEAGVLEGGQKPRGRVKMLKKELLEDYMDQLYSLNQANKLPAKLMLAIKDLISERDNNWMMSFSKTKQKKYVKKKSSCSKETEVISISEIEKEEKKESYIQQISPFGKMLEQYKKTMINEIIRVNKYNKIYKYS